MNAHPWKAVLLIRNIKKDTSVDVSFFIARIFLSDKRKSAKKAGI